MTTERLAQPLVSRTVSSMDELTAREQTAVVDLYIDAFALPPYQEKFTTATAHQALERVLGRPGGELVVGESDGRIVTLAGGYLRTPSDYFIEELAVDPTEQGRGYGRQTLRVLLGTAAAQSADRLEICTTVGNDKALALCASEGFERTRTTLLAFHIRTDQSIKVDERIYLQRARTRRSADGDDVLRRVVVAYPSGNTTALVFDQRLGDERASLNSAVLEAIERVSPDVPEVEQCLFVTTPTSPGAIARVEMFGGEFCGNATRSAIWVLTGGADYSSFIESSGVDKPLKFTVESGHVDLEMPLPDDARTVAVPVDEGTLVRLEGITHLVRQTSAARQDTPREQLAALLAENRYGLSDDAAVGVSDYNSATGAADFCVWVRAVDSLFDETACGSGTCSIGIAAAARSQQDEILAVTQPSGEVITTSCRYERDRGITWSLISGEVSILFDGEAVLSRRA